MTIKEASTHLLWSVEKTTTAVKKGIRLKSTDQVAKLPARKLGSAYDIDESELDAFMKLLEAEEPGRRPPVAVQRELCQEAGYRCAICKHVAPVQFHHMIEWADVKHHDPRHMLAVCGTCHDLCGRGLISYASQKDIKRRLHEAGSSAADRPTALIQPLRITWANLKDLITEAAKVVDPGAKNGIQDFRYRDVTEKNELNNLGEKYFAMMRDFHEPYFGRIEKFLGSPANEAPARAYDRVVGELRTRIAAQEEEERFEAVLMRFHSAALESGLKGIQDNTDLLLILLSFMYFNCDIGRKQ